MLQSVKRAMELNSTHPKLHECLVKFGRKGKYRFTPQIMNLFIGMKITYIASRVIKIQTKEFHEKTRLTLMIL